MIDNSKSNQKEEIPQGISNYDDSKSDSLFYKISVSPSFPYTPLRGMIFFAMAIVFAYWATRIGISSLHIYYDSKDLIEPYQVMHTYNLYSTNSLFTTIIPLVFSLSISLLTDKVRRERREHKKRAQAIINAL